MKKILSTVIIALLAVVVLAETNFTGRWFYSPSDRVSFSINLKQNDSIITGTHSGVYQGGNRIDASLGKDDITINGNVTNNKARVTIQSGYEAKVPGIVELEMINQDSIRFKMITPPSDGIYYMPKNVIMTRVKQ